MLNSQIDMADKLEVIENDKRLKGASSQGSTFFAHTHNDVGGRFAAVSSPQVIGSVPSPATQYTTGRAWSAADQGLEPPLNYSVNALEPTGEIAELKASIADDAPLGPSTHSAKATSSAHLPAEPGDLTDASLPPGAVISPIFKPTTFRRA